MNNIKDHTTLDMDISTTKESASIRIVYNGTNCRHHIEIRHTPYDNPSCTSAPSSPPVVARVGGPPRVPQYPRVLRHPCLLRWAPNLKMKRRRIGTILPSHMLTLELNPFFIHLGYSFDSILLFDTLIPVHTGNGRRCSCLKNLA